MGITIVQKIYITCEIVLCESFVQIDLRPLLTLMLKPVEPVKVYRIQYKQLLLICGLKFV